MSDPVDVTPEALRRMALPLPHEGSKEERGRVLVVAGCAEVPGAALLAGTAALRAGAGKLQIATVAEAALPLGLAVPEARVIGLPEAGGCIDPAAAVARLSAYAPRCDSLLVGPGMMEGAPVAALRAALLEAAPSAAVVLDAAGLSDLPAQAEAVRAREGRVVITPHAGEMAALLGRPREAIEADPRGAAQSASDLLGAVVVMKGARTLVVAPRGAAWLYRGGGVGLATSGSGDVLAGLIAGLLARGAAPAQAAVWGVYLHGEAGRDLADRCGPLGFLARELAGLVPGLLRKAGGRA
ncbi:carbohydrate kinase, YjeF related protein [Methylobacterium sp. 4-46]|uniref:NAD(P)H-hydrate dehydratase n=1 Tax=unclassified Methylobacterium TaxID=2615210 RepID=UPI000165C774|nr:MULTISPECIES: NAD(P)H-hydrate dehydratase [Methylobacterium]ACA15300.1 carbohydrate kinase, YjeF related protein [Methylobacterium sp. 4-46]WFT81026.1 NAD(P)H-hydrate dehydratase [Methylobacterium nodulans]